jgi:anti-anti-sigma regulatory factor
MEKESISATGTPANLHTIHVLLEGELVIRNAKKIRNELMLALVCQQNPVIVLKQVTKIDLSIIQLLIGLQKSAASLGKKISYRSEQPEYIKTIVEHSGFGEILDENFKNAE